MDFDTLLATYNKQVDLPRSLVKERKTILLHHQLKTYRNALCKKSKRPGDILKIEYAYIISALNHRHRIWKYDYMTFPRRIGELWESFCKAPFYNAKKPLRPFSPPSFNSIKDEIDTIPSQAWDLIGRVNLKQDILFYQNRRLHIIDMKSSFNSNEKGNAQRMKTIGLIYKLWKPRVKLHIYIRQDHDNNYYLDHLEDTWNIQSGNEAYLSIKDFTGINIKNWINRNIDFEDHLDPVLHKFLKRKNLTKYLEW